MKLESKISRAVVATHDASRRWAWQNARWLPGDLERVEAGCIEEVRQLLTENLPLLLVLYLDLPVGNALELVRQGRARKMPVLALGSGAREACAAMENGAQGYLDVADSAEETSAALSAVTGGRIYVSKRWEQVVLSRVHRVPGSGQKGIALESLSHTERNIWEQVAMGQKTVEIARNRGVSVKTIESHLHRMQVKLSCKGLSELRRKAAHWRAAAGGSN